MEDTLVIGEAVEITRAVCVRPGCSQAVGTSDIERFRKRSVVRVSQRYVDASIKTGSNANRLRQVEFVAKFGSKLDKLVE